MNSTPTVAQRLGRVLERLTRQSARPTRPPAFGSLLLGGLNESPRRRRRRIQSILTVFLLSVNVVGIALAFLLIVVAFPEPSVFNDVPWWVPFIVTPAYIVGALAAGTWWMHVRTLNDLRWAVDGQEPSRTDQRNTYLTPWRIAMAHLVLWGTGAALLSALFGWYYTDFIPRMAITVGFAGIVVPPSFPLTFNTGSDVRELLGVPARNLLLSEWNVDYERPVIAGDRLLVTSRVAEVGERPSPAGRIEVAVIEDEGRDENGQLVVKVRRSYIVRNTREV
jgi:hypothetical protein